MATSTLVQFLAAGEGTDTSNRRQVETFLADGAIASGAMVMFDIAETADGDKVLKIVEGTAAKHGFGASLKAEAAAAGDRTDVCISGICEALVEGVNSSGTNAAIAAGDYLSMSDNAGVLGLYRAGTDGVPLAVAVDAVASGAATAKVSVIILKHF